MALLVLLPRAAPARVVAADLVALVDMPCRDDRHHELLLSVGGGGPLGDHARGGGGEGAWLRVGGSAGVAQPPGGARVGRGRPGGLRSWRGAGALTLHLDLDVEDVAGELLPDRVDERLEHLEALVL